MAEINGELPPESDAELALYSNDKKKTVEDSKDTVDDDEQE